MLCIPFVFAEQNAADPISAGPGLAGPGVGGTDVGGAAASVQIAGDPVPVGPQVDNAVIPADTEKNASSGSDISVNAIPRLATPILKSPEIAEHFYHYPRVTTLAWNAVAGANRYKVERQYSDGTWHSYPDVYTTAPATSYTFTFVGDQPGRWRVTAIDTTGAHLTSYASAYRTFSYTTGFTLATPIKISPTNGTHFYNYPRTTTLTWKPIPGATGYKVERKYCLGTACWDYPPVTTTQSYLNFNFVGAQPGKWRVTALGGTTPDAKYYDSVPSTWRVFTYHI